MGGRGLSGGAPASPLILTPPPCQVPLRSGLPSGVRGMGLCVTGPVGPLGAPPLPLPGPGACPGAWRSRQPGRAGAFQCGSIRFRHRGSLAACYRQHRRRIRQHRRRRDKRENSKRIRFEYWHTPRDPITRRRPAPTPKSPPHGTHLKEEGRPASKQDVPFIHSKLLRVLRVSAVNCPNRYRATLPGKNPSSFRALTGCCSFRIAFASIWRTRSRVTLKIRPTSSRV